VVSAVSVLLHRYGALLGHIIRVRKTVPKIVPSGRLDVLSCKWKRTAETRISTSEYEYMQTALNY
jgi:hypothetical protein